MSVDIAHLRALLAGNGLITVRPSYIAGRSGFSLQTPDEEDDSTEIAFSWTEADAALIAAAVNALPALLDELEALRAELAEQDIALGQAECLDAAWRQATGCDTPVEAREVVATFDVACELAGQQHEAWRAATLGTCSSPAELADKLRRRAAVEHERNAELALLRELRDAVLEYETLRSITDVGFAGRAGAVERVQTAIAACRKFREGR